jgi:beta-lactamase regulating signal transducer with metallopeptidase domain
VSEILSSAWAAVGWSIVWQSTLALAAGLLAAAICARRPARADGLLVAAVVAALAMPVGTFAVRQLGWGVLVPHSPSTTTPLLPASYPPNVPAPSGESPASRAPAMTAVQAAGEPALSTFARRKDVLSRSERRPRTSRSASWRAWAPLFLSAAWLALSVAAFMQLAGAAWVGRKLLAASLPMRDARVDRALASAAERLKLAVKVEARTSADVRCPVVWCWSRQPIVLLPVNFVGLTDESRWLGIFCHELAHWKRQDHLSSFAADWLRCVVPWQPLGWWAARRHEQLSELACDEWVLALGEPAENYADSLLRMVPQRRSPLALAVVRNRAGLMGRIWRILHLAHPQPALGRKWILGIAGSTFVLVAVVAIVQQKPLAASAQAAGSALAGGPSAAASESAGAQAQQVSGIVLDVWDKPVAGARVYWVGLVRADWSTLPHDDPRRDKLDLFAEEVTDDRGCFTMSANFDWEPYNFPSIVVRHDGHGLGLQSYLFTEQTGPLEIHLPEAIPIRGRILTPNGMPVASAEVLPTYLQALVRRPKQAATESEKVDSLDERWGWLSVSDFPRRRGELPSFWPKAVKTDADGRFALPGGDNSGMAVLHIAAEGFGPHGVRIADEEYLVEWNKNKRGGHASPPLANNFTLVLEPPRQIEGTFTDAKTGQPVGGVEIAIESSRDPGYTWVRRLAQATSSDLQGGYRLLVPATGYNQHVRIYPPLGYLPAGGRIYLESEFEELFVNSRTYRNDVQLTPGRVLRGRVVDADSRAPVRDAAILYRPGPGNASVGGGDYWFDEPVLTDDDGKFQITAFEGAGVISVDTRSREHIRTTLPPDLAGGRADVGPHAYAAINLTDSGEIPPLELVVERGTDLVIEPAGPDGQPVSPLYVAYREVGVPATGAIRSHHTRELPLRLRGCAPGKTYRLLIGTPDCELGTVAEVLCDPGSGPTKVPLRPSGALRGRLVYADGTPAADVQTFLRFRDDPPSVVEAGASPEARQGAALVAQNPPYYGNVMKSKGERSVTDANGEFEIRGLVPGVYLYLNINYDFSSGHNYQWAGLIDAGKTLDMGQLVIKP